MQPGTTRGRDPPRGHRIEFQNAVAIGESIVRILRQEAVQDSERTGAHFGSEGSRVHVRFADNAFADLVEVSSLERRAPGEQA